MSSHKNIIDRQPGRSVAYGMVWTFAAVWETFRFIKQNRVRIAEVIITIGLLACSFVLVRQFAVGVPGNSTNLWCFSAGSTHSYHLQQPGDGWKGRTFAFMTAGWCFDHATTVEQYMNDFGLYQCAWIALMFAVSMMAFRHPQSLMINLLIFAGVIWNVTPDSSLYWYSWDLSSAFFMLLTFVLFDRRQYWLMLMAVCVGTMFKETMLVCFWMFLFVPVQWWKRLSLAVAPWIFYALVKHVMLAGLGLNVATFSENQNDWKTTNTDIGPFHKPEYNLVHLFSPVVDLPLLMNCGCILALVFCLWRKRFVPYLLPLGSFVGGIMAMGTVTEYHDFVQIIPVCAMIVACPHDDSETTRSNALTIIAVVVCALAVFISYYQWDEIINLKLAHVIP